MNKQAIIKDAVQSYNYPAMLYPGHYDGRKKVFRRALKYLRPEELTKARMVYNQRETRRQFKPNVWNIERRRLFLQMVKAAEYNPSAFSSRHNKTGIDWCAYHRPSGENGWVLIAPDEPANNWYCDDKQLVRYLKSVYKI